MLQVRTITVTPFAKNMFKEFFSIDSDYEENVEYFREDTLDLGYKNEAERCSEEYSKKFQERWRNNEYQDDEGFYKLINDMLEECANDSSIDSTFYLGNSTYCNEYHITVIEPMVNTNYDEDVTVVVSYVSNC